MNELKSPNQVMNALHVHVETLELKVHKALADLDAYDKAGVWDWDRARIRRIQELIAECHRVFQQHRQIETPESKRIAELDCQAGAPVMNWQPIETAPKTEDVLLCDDHGHYVGGWIADSLIHGRDCWMIHGGSAVTPTHWMPLPPLPETRPL